MSEQRFVFRQDSDCHWYMIPIEAIESFENWNNEDTETDEFDPDRFYHCALGGGIQDISFTLPQTMNEEH